MMNCLLDAPYQAHFRAYFAKCYVLVYSIVYTTNLLKIQSALTLNFISRYS